jgi:hypothetical protein
VWRLLSLEVAMGAREIEPGKRGGWRPNSGRKIVDRTGMRFGRLVVVGAKRQGRHTLYECSCDCGGSAELRADVIVRGDARSCGCLRVENHAALAERTKTHGQSLSLTWRSWRGMRARCFNALDQHWPDYGGRGITVCDRWEDFSAFLTDMGERPSLKHSIDRIDVNGDYEPGNCRWATYRQQADNKRNTVRVSALGRQMTATEWDAELGFRKGTVAKRVRRLGWSEHRAVTTPISEKHRRLAWLSHTAP